jgi:hypothetical protein
MANQVLKQDLIRSPYALSYLMFETGGSSSAIVRQFPLTNGTSTVTDASQLTTETPVTTVFYTSRLATNYTITPSTVLSLTTAFYYTTTNPNAAVRLHLYKVQQGGTNTETLIGYHEGTTAIPDSTASKDTYTFTIPETVECAAGERFLLRVWFKPVGATYTATDKMRWTFGNPLTSNPAYGTLNCPADMTWMPNRTILYLHRTASAAGGNFFEMNTTAPTSGTAQAGVVNTVASGTQVQWTRTAGGTLLEWATGRFKESWRLDPTGFALSTDGAASFFGIGALESNLAANCGLRGQIFRRRPNGSETLCISMDGVAEFGTTLAIYQLHAEGSSIAANVTFTTTDFFADDRLVVRLYIIPIGGVMGSGRTCTLNYDSTSSTNTNLRLFETALIKADADPDDPPGTPGSQTTLGVGN